MKKLNQLKAGEKIRVKRDKDGKWMNATVASEPALKDKFVLLENGEELFDFDVYEIEKLSAWEKLKDSLF